LDLNNLIQIKAKFVPNAFSFGPSRSFLLFQDAYLSLLSKNCFICSFFFVSKNLPVQKICFLKCTTLVICRFFPYFKENPFSYMEKLFSFYSLQSEKGQIEIIGQAGIIITKNRFNTIRCFSIDPNKNGCNTDSQSEHADKDDHILGVSLPLFHLGFIPSGPL